MKKSIITLFFVLLISHSFSQQNSHNYKIMFYNVENFFDTKDDSLKNDDDFLPQGNYYWNKQKYYTKLNHIYKVIIALGEWNPPAIIGLCEVENRKVLRDLTYNTSLVKYEYKIIHKESPDIRGIDVAVLYREKYFKPISKQAIHINFPNDSITKTRDILYVKGKTNNNDTLQVFVNHWPSRWGGQLESENKRLFVAKVLKLKVDSILEINPESNIIIMGDFNDYPDNKSIRQILNAKLEYGTISNIELYNLSSIFYKKTNIGSHKFQGEWGVLDQFIVSGNLLNEKNKVYTTPDDVFIYNNDFLLEPDETYFGYKPFRTFSGYKYLGGFSDHLPTYLILNFNE